MNKTRRNESAETITYLDVIVRPKRPRTRSNHNSESNGNELRNPRISGIKTRGNSGNELGKQRISVNEIRTRGNSGNELGNRPNSLNEIRTRGNSGNELGNRQNSVNEIRTRRNSVNEIRTRGNSGNELGNRPNSVNEIRMQRNSGNETNRTKFEFGANNQKYEVALSEFPNNSKENIKIPKILNIKHDFQDVNEFSPTDVSKQNRYLNEVKNDLIKLNADNIEKEKRSNESLNGLKQCVDYTSSELVKQQNILNEINKIREGMKI
uniref:Uncharacterized protein n=1 Tax=viral metagenome TaxID=1070528 RepID=A0A6C0HSB8_9ZZZZ